MKNHHATADLIRLRDILSEADTLSSYTSKELESQRNLYAAAFSFTIIGEASRHVSAEFKKRHTELPWRDMADMRNKIVHEYGLIDPDMMMQVIREDLPSLQEQIRKLIEFYSREIS